MILDPQTFIVMGLIALVPTASSIVGMIVNIRSMTQRQPPLDKELAEFMKRSDCNPCRTAIFDRINADRTEWQTEIRALRLTEQEDIKQILYAMKRLENK